MSEVTEKSLQDEYDARVRTRAPDPRIEAAKALVAAPGWDSMYRLIEMGLNRDSLVAYNAFMPLLEAQENLRKALEDFE